MTHDSVSPEFPSTPELILVRFAAEYKDHKTDQRLRLRIEYDNGHSQDGYIYEDPGGWWWSKRYPRASGHLIEPSIITRIDYSNAHYRGERPLYQREGAA